ncbi:MAG: hypothetical protein N3A38_16045 [Planctomycetota bacterium]|nr:hypothetical protein [Planctomycetota bacterium]
MIRHESEGARKEARPGPDRVLLSGLAIRALAPGIFAVAAAGTGGLLLPAAGCACGEDAPLRFVFRKDRPLAYRVRVRSTSSQVLTCGMQTIESPPQSRDVTFEMRLVPGESEDGARFPCSVSVGSFKGSATFQTEDNKKATLRTDGTDVFVEVDGKVTLDTSRGANPGKAEQLMRLLGFRGGDVRVILDGRGRKLKVEGDQAAARWFESASSAFFPVLLPEKVVADGEAWEERVEIANLERFRLKTPMGATMRYTLRSKAPTTLPAGIPHDKGGACAAPDSGRHAAVVEIASSCRLEAKDVEAEIPLNLKKLMSRFTVRSMTIDTEGTASFNREAGEFVGGYRKGIVRSEVEMRPVEGEVQVARVEGTVEMRYELAGAAGEKPEGGSTK